MSEIRRSWRWFRVLWSSSRKSVRLLLLAIAILVIALVLAQAQSLLVSLEVGRAGVGLVGERFMIAVPIINDGTVTAANVQVSGATWGTAPRLSPATFPDVLGSIGPDANAVFQADFNVTGLSPHTRLPLTITGTYQVNEVTFNFTLTKLVTLPQSGPRSVPSATGSAPPESLEGSPYPPGTAPSVPDDAEPGPPIPIGPYVAGTPSAPTSVQSPASQPGTSAQAVRPQTMPSDPAVSIPLNEQWEHLICVGCVPAPGVVGQGDPNEPSGASGGGVLFMSFNWSAVYSIEASGTFNTVDPHVIFPHSPQILYSVCCDQVVEYVPPPIDRFVWVQQLTQSVSGPDANMPPGAYRLAAASPADIIKFNGQKDAWTSWLFVPEEMNFNHVTEFDRPAMSVGDNYLYIAWDQRCPMTGPALSGCVAGRQIIRTRLTNIKAGGTLHYDYLPDPAWDGSAWGDYPTEDTGDTVFWLGQNGTSSMNVFYWPESSSSLFESAPISISTWVLNYAGPGTSMNPHIASNAPYPIAGFESPVSQDWLYKGSANWMSATRSQNQAWFAWSSARHGNFPQPYIEMLEVDTTTLTETNQVQIWNPDFAYGFAALATNACTKEIGISLAYGGGSNYPNHAVGFWGDYLFYQTTNGGVTGSQYGDFLTIRQNTASDLHGAYFDAFGYALVNNGSAGKAMTLPASAVDVDTRRVIFGRPGVCGQSSGG